MQDVNVSLEQSLDGTLPRVDSDWIAPKDARHLYPVTRFAHIDKFLICAQGNGVRGLSIGYVIWSLLKLNHLLVRKFAAVVHDLHGILRLAGLSRASRRLHDLAPIKRYVDGMIADLTTEECSLHVWYDWRRSNNEAFDADHLVHIYHLLVRS